MNNAKIAWDFFKSKGLNDYAVAGVWGNIQAESNFNPENLQNSYEKKLGYTDRTYTAAVDNGSYTNFVKDAAGYGLAQWTYWSRKQELYNYCKAINKSVGDMQAQLAFMWQEMQGYKKVMDILQNAKTVREASDAVMIHYEAPGDQSEAAKKKRAEYGQAGYDKYAGTKEEPSKGSGDMIKTNLELVAKLKDIAQNYKTLYVMGCFGAPLNEANKKRYTANHSYNKQANRTAMINAASADTFGFDCVCLIKGVLWGWNGDKNAAYGGAKYASNGVPDIGADTFITKCTGVTTNFSDIEAGEAVWCSGHIGVYIGNGLAVECTPSFANKVQITAVKNIGTKTGYSARTWTKHGKIPYITYKASEQTEPAKPEHAGQQEPGVKVGDIVTFTGTKHYRSANETNAASCKCKPGRAKVTATANGKHPVHLVSTREDSCTVYGWVDAADIKTGQAAAPEQAKRVHKVKRGDTLTAIAKKYGTTINTILEANRKKYPSIKANYIVVGWELVV